MLQNADNPNASRPKPLFSFYGLWLQITGLLFGTALLVAVLIGVVYEHYWRQVMQVAPPETRAFFEAVRLPIMPGDERPQLEGISLRPGAVSVTVGLLLIALLGAFVARRALRPLANLERTTQRLAGGELAARSSTINTGAFSGLVGHVNAIAERLEGAEAARRLANAAIAHELRTPLTALRVRVEGLQAGVFPASTQELGKLHAQLDVLEKLVTDLQVLTLFDAGELRLETQHFDLAALLRAACEDHAPRAHRAGLELRVHAPEHLPCPGDPERLRQVLHNLLENAIRHTPPGGAITLRLEAQAGRAALSVSDSGPGVPADQLSLLFTPYHRAEPARSRSGGGSGLGLAVVRAIVHAHRGEVSAHKAKEGGLEVRLLLRLG
jgi:two-component system, OmpR family, sensor histidine kinase BaeS